MQIVCVRSLRPRHLTEAGIDHESPRQVLSAVFTTEQDEMDPD